MTEKVQGKNLYLRHLQASDLDRTWEWLHRPDIYSRIGVQVPFSKEQQITWFNNLQTEQNKIVFAICRNCDDTHIGNLSIDTIDRRHHNARFSIFIAETNDRGKGYGSEALCLLESFAFQKLGLHKIWCKTDAGNPTVLRFYQHLGFFQEGVLKEHEWKEGKYVDKIILAKLNGIKQTKCACNLQ